MSLRVKNSDVAPYKNLDLPYLEEGTRFYAKYFEEFPSVVLLNNLEYSPFHNLLLENGFTLFSNYNSSSWYDVENKKFERTSSKYINEANKCLIIPQCSSYNCFFLYYSLNSLGIEDLIYSIMKCVEEEEDSYIPEVILPCRNGGEFSSTEVELDVEKLSNEELDLFYENGVETHQKFTNFLEQESGLALLCGEPGTGKSSFLKNLIASTDYEFIYCTPENLDVLGDSQFISFLLEHPKAILIGEDAENVLVAGEVRDRITANLLNITDGILSSLLKIKVIFTFNTEVDNLDEALLRPGRLKLFHKMNKLSVEHSNNVLSYLNKPVKVNQECSLATLFNYGE